MNMMPSSELKPNEFETLIPLPPASQKKWFSILRGKEGFLAFSFHRLTGIILFLYLILHLSVLSLLAVGPTAWDRFLSVVRSPVFILLDGALLFGLFFHGINGVRLSLIGLNWLVGYQKALVYLTVVLSVLLSLIGTFYIFIQ